jgi:hypothetical protein
MPPPSGAARLTRRVINTAAYRRCGDYTKYTKYKIQNYMQNDYVQVLPSPNGAAILTINKQNYTVRQLARWFPTKLTAWYSPMAYLTSEGWERPIGAPYAYKIKD